jgi:hypothetical protein
VFSVGRDVDTQAFDMDQVETIDNLRRSSATSQQRTSAQDEWAPTNLGIAQAAERRKRDEPGVWFGLRKPPREGFP